MASIEQYVAIKYFGGLIYRALKCSNRETKSSSGLYLRRDSLELDHKKLSKKLCVPNGVLPSHSTRTRFHFGTPNKFDL